MRKIFIFQGNRFKVYRDTTQKSIILHYPAYQYCIPTNQKSIISDSYQIETMCTNIHKQMERI